MLSVTIRSLMVGASVLLTASAAVLAQSPGRLPGMSSSTGVVPTFGSLAPASVNQDYTAIQLRRFRDEKDNVVTIRERVAVDADGTLSPPYSLTFLAVEGEPAGSPVTLAWQNAYPRYAQTFFQHSLFRVRQLSLAVSNYTLHDFGPVSRIGRPARRMVVFPKSGGKAIWILDIDTQTNLPLYSAEFDDGLRLLSEVEAVTFDPTVSVLAPMPPALALEEAPDFTSACSLISDPIGLVEPNLPIVPDFSIDRIEVTTDPLNGQQKLVLNYSDGIDQFVIEQVPGAPDPFAGLPSQAGGGTSTVARFRDPALSAFVFWQGGVSFRLGGRGAMKRLDEVTKRLYLQAVSD